MAEVYELAVLRDMEFNYFEGALVAGNPSSEAVHASIERLNRLDYIKSILTVLSLDGPGKVNDNWAT